MTKPEIDLSAAPNASFQLESEKENSEKEASSLTEAYVEKPFLRPENIGQTLLDRLPSPTGWRILILPYRGKGQTEGGIYLP